MSAMAAGPAQPARPSPHDVIGALRGALLGDPEAEATLRRLLQSGQLSDELGPLARGILGLSSE